MPVLSGETEKLVKKKRETFSSSHCQGPKREFGSRLARLFLACSINLAPGRRWGHRRPCGKTEHPRANERTCAKGRIAGQEVGLRGRHQIAVSSQICCGARPYLVLSSLSCKIYVSGRPEKGDGTRANHRHHRALAITGPTRGRIFRHETVCDSVYPLRRTRTAQEINRPE